MCLHNCLLMKSRECTHVTVTRDVGKVKSFRGIATVWQVMMVRLSISDRNTTRYGSKPTLGLPGKTLIPAGAGFFFSFFIFFVTMIEVDGDVKCWYFRDLSTVACHSQCREFDWFMEVTTQYMILNTSTFSEYVAVSWSVIGKDCSYHMCSLFRSSLNSIALSIY